MNLNSDFGARAAIHAARLDWTPSPIPGVDRRMLDRIGDEVARATSIVRYAPHSCFAPHIHGGGEEFLVLEGVFQDEHGDYPTGTYVRNPPTSSQTPGCEPGCTIFVKLWQFEPDDRTPVRIDTSGLSFAPAPDLPGVEFALLYEDVRELVLLERWAPGINIAVPLPRRDRIARFGRQLYRRRRGVRPALVAQTAGRCNAASHCGTGRLQSLGQVRPSRA